MKPFNKDGFKELEQRWYQKLEKSGFKDIEDTKNPYRPLKSWHSFRRVPGAEITSNAKRDFFDLAWELIHTANFKKKHYRKIWVLFCDGLSERQIARKVRLPKSTVHWIIARISRDIQWK